MNVGLAPASPQIVLWFHCTYLFACTQYIYGDVPRADSTIGPLRLVQTEGLFTKDDRHAQTCSVVNYTSTCLDSAERITTVFRYSFHCGGSSTATTVFAAKMNTSTANVQPWTLPRISLFYIHSDCRFMEGVR